MVCSWCMNLAAVDECVFPQLCLYLLSLSKSLKRVLKFWESLTSLMYHSEGKVRLCLDLTSVTVDTDLLKAMFVSLSFLSSDCESLSTSVDGGNVLHFLTMRSAARLYNATIGGGNAPLVLRTQQRKKRVLHPLAWVVVRRVLTEKWLQSYKMRWKHRRWPKTKRTTLTGVWAWKVSLLLKRQSPLLVHWYNITAVFTAEHRTGLLYIEI